MLIMRLLLLLAVLSIGGSAILWLLTGNPRYKAWAWKAFRADQELACDATVLDGSTGEQIQQTNFAQHGDMSDVFRLRGGYSESWTVFWITAHFLNAAAEFERMGVDLDRPEDPR